MLPTFVCVKKQDYKEEYAMELWVMNIKGKTRFLSSILSLMYIMYLFPWEVLKEDSIPML